MANISDDLKKNGSNKKAVKTEKKNKNSKRKVKIDMKKVKNCIDKIKVYLSSKKIDKKKAMIVGACVFLLFVFLISSFASSHTKNIKRVKNWAFSFQYNLDTASQDCMKNIKWKDKHGTVTLSGRDKKTNDKLFFTFKVGEYMSFESMTRNGKQMKKFDWDTYFSEYKK